ncbi:MAG: glutamyl-tRNA reductase [Desulfobacca sp.]|uniref:glutamyl-tRNA reductase n=1 Tax=Desulfobacca sp. TaxID=2067990 RepID=UPI00404A2300
MTLVIIGLNHKTAPVELREKLAALAPEPAAAYQYLRALQTVPEALFYATCNRVEILFASPEPETAIPQVRQLFLAQGDEADVQALQQALYIYCEGEAVSHLFQVACGLDSMVVGEPQILGQIKAAYRQGTAQQATGPLLNRLLHKTFSVAKKVRSETGIGGLAVSVSYAAVELARKIFGSLTDKTGLLIGAGEMAELAVEHLKRQGVARLIVANRTVARGLELASRFQGQAVSLAELPEQLLQADIVISSTGAPEMILTKDQIKGVMRRRKQRPLFLIDIAVPRDLDPAINELDNVYLYNIDDLQGVIQANLHHRQEEAVKAQRIIAVETEKFLQWRETLAVTPTIVALVDKAKQICQSELKKTLPQLGPLTPEQQKSLEILAESIAFKLLHDPFLYLKRNHHPKRRSQDIDLTRRLFNLDPDRSEDLR